MTNSVITLSSELITGIVILSIQASINFISEKWVISSGSSCIIRIALSFLVVYIPRYVDTFEEEEPVGIKATQVEINRLKGELAGVEKQMSEYLKELGF